jgi:hypothetical protein
MKKRKKVFYFVALFTLLIFSISCASIPINDNKIEQTEQIVETEIEDSVEVLVEPSTPVMEDIPAVSLYKDKRYITHNDLKRFGQFIVIYNDSSDKFVQIDIFDEAMYAKEKTINNLLEEDDKLDYREQIWIDLDEHPSLQKALLEGPERLFVINAFNDLGDLYTKTWNPFLDFWDITIDDSNRIYNYQRDLPEAYSDQLLVANESGYDFISLQISFDNNTIEFLTDFNLSDRKAIVVNLEKFATLKQFIEDNKNQTLILKAIDKDGDFYSYFWNPNYYNWLLRFDESNLDFNLETESSMVNDYVLRLINNSGIDIWYLHIVDDDMLDYETEGMEIIGSRIFFNGESLKFNLDNHNFLNHYRDAQIEDTLTIIAYDQEDGRYVFEWDPLDKRPIELTGWTSFDNF